MRITAVKVVQAYKKYSIVMCLEFLFGNHSSYFAPNSATLVFHTAFCLICNRYVSSNSTVEFPPCLTEIL